MVTQKSFTIQLTDMKERGWAYSVNCPQGLCGVGFGVNPVDAAKTAVKTLNRSIKFMAKEENKSIDKTSTLT